MKCFLVAGTFLTTMLAGCMHGSPGAIAFDTPAQLQAEATDDLCTAYGVNQGAAVWTELERRRAIRPEFAEKIVANEVSIGMSPCEVLASWKAPDRVSRLILASGTRVRWVYDDFNGRPLDFVYFTNGVVTAIKD